MPTRKSITASLIAVALPFTASAYFKYIPAPPPEIPESVAPVGGADATAIPLPDTQAQQVEQLPASQQPPQQHPADAGPAGVRFSGAPSSKSASSVVRSGGIDRFSVATLKIAPAGWTVENRIPAGMDNRAVEWSAGRPWPQTMDGIAQQAGRSVLVDWGAQSIVIE